MILVAGIGNIFLADDAFGVEVAQQMLRQPPIDGVRVIDFGIRGLDLTYALADEQYAAAILVDAVPRGESPGTVFVIEPSESDFEAPPDEALIDAHNMHPLKVLRLARSMGAALSRILVVGCEPTPFNPETDMEMTLSAPVRAALPRAIEVIHQQIEILKRKLVADASTESKGVSHHESPVATA